MELTDIKPGMIAYLAAPYTAKTSAETDERIRLFCKVDELLVHQHRIVTVSPLSKHMIFMHNPTAAMGGDWMYWENYSKTLLKRCDVLIVIRLPGWDESKGVNGEVEFALEHKIPIIFVDENGR